MPILLREEEWTGGNSKDWPPFSSESSALQPSSLSHLGYDFLLMLVKLDSLQCDTAQLLNVLATVKLATHTFQGKC